MITEPSLSPLLAPRIPLIALIGLAWALLIDTFGDVKLGPVSLSGAVTIGVACMAVALIPWVLVARRLNSVGASGQWQPFLPGRFSQRFLPLPLKGFLALAL